MQKHALNKNNPIALVIGLCSHGLSMARALHSQGVEVHALESNNSIAGIKTSVAKIHWVDNIKSVGIVEDLISFRTNIDPSREIVLFPSNDVHVKIIGENINKLNDIFLLSWKNSVDDILSLLLKDNIEKRCDVTGLNYPKSITIRSLADVSEVSQAIAFPIIAKPVTPQSGFKAIKCDDKEQLISLIETYHEDLPILVQHWISGTDKDIYFAALYLHEGNVTSTFIGQKLESYPLAMGQTTVAVTSDNQEVLELTKTFFHGLKISGPVSLELKKDDEGRYWVIEPTVGRTDFWVELCISAGFNIIHEEYSFVVEQKQSNKQVSISSTIWFDTEKDILSFVRHLPYVLPWKEKSFSPSFTYLNQTDIKPFISAFFKSTKKVILSIAKRLRTTTSKESINSQYKIESYTNIADMPSSFKSLFDLGDNKEQLFSSQRWYENFVRFICKEKNERIEFVCISDINKGAVLILPLWFQLETINGVRTKVLSSLTNYYSPNYCFIGDPSKLTEAEMASLTLKYLNSVRSEWDLVLLSPLYNKTKDALISAQKSIPVRIEFFTKTENLFLHVNGSFENYLSELPKKTYNTLKRKQKKLDKEVCWNVNLYSENIDLQRELSKYHEVYRESWKVDEPFDGFIDGLASYMANDAALRLGILEIEEEPVAAQIWFVKNKTAYIYKLAYKSNFRKYSPGTVLLAKMIERAIDIDNVEIIDFLTGDDAYKYDWMNHSQTLYGMQIFNNCSLIGKYLMLINSLSKILNKTAKKIKD